MTSQYPPAGSQSSPGGQAPPRRDAFEAFGQPESPGAQPEQSPTVPGQSPSSAAGQSPSSGQADPGKIEF
jgi:hypothetical protein